MLIFYLAGLLIACLILVRSGTLIVQLLSRIAQYLQISEFIVAFILMAFATDIPEMMIGITSALNGTPELALGNIIGANIIKLTLILGSLALVADGLYIESKIMRREAFFACLISVLPLILILDKNLSRFDGLILILALFIYLGGLLEEKKKFTRTFVQEVIENHKFIRFKNFFKNLFKFLGGIILLMSSAYFVVVLSLKVAHSLDLSVFIIGLFIIALGTDLPEIVFGFRALRLNHESMIVGNLIGAVAINSTLILGLVSLIHPIKIAEVSMIFTGVIFILLTLFLFYVFAQTRERISRSEAMILIVVYMLFLLFEYLSN